MIRAACYGYRARPAGWPSRHKWSTFAPLAAVRRIPADGTFRACDGRKWRRKREHPTWPKPGAKGVSAKWLSALTYLTYLAFAGYAWGGASCRSTDLSELSRVGVAPEYA